MYRGIAKQIHPDIHPELAEVEELQDLWNQVNIAYQCNDLEQLKELDLLISVTLAGLSEQKAILDIPDIEAKIKKLEWEIREIRSKDLLKNLIRFLRHRNRRERVQHLRGLGLHSHRECPEGAGYRADK